MNSCDPPEEMVADAGVSPAGSVSVTVTASVVAVLAAMFETVSVYVPDPPSWNVPACVFVILRSAGATMFVGSEAVLFPAF